MDSEEKQQSLVELGKQLKAARIKAGLSQAEVAKRAKLNVSWYAVVERGEGDLSYGKLERVLKVLGIKKLDIP